MSAQRERARRPVRSPAEWVAFAVASAVLLFVVGAIVSMWVDGDDRPPHVVVEQEGEIRQVGSTFYVPVTVINRGGRTAENVQVLAELSRDGEVIEDGEQAIDFLAGGETEELEFVFTEDPGSGQFTVRAGSFTRP
jgi:uncharacterized protein (TIGR02588 family)